MSTSSGEMSVLLAKMKQMQQQNSLEQALIKQQLSRLSQSVEALHARQAQQSDQYSHASAAPEGQQQHMHQRARRAVDQESVLARDEVLDTVLSFVGIGEYYYVAGVCRNWRGRFISVCSQTGIPSKKKLNTYRISIMATAARLQLALDNGLTIAQCEARPYALAVALAAGSLEAHTRCHSQKQSLRSVIATAIYSSKSPMSVYCC
jgi:hypothetical protein